MTERGMKRVMVGLACWSILLVSFAAGVLLTRSLSPAPVSIASAVDEMKPEAAARTADQPAPLWNGQESVKDYAQRAGIRRIGWALELGSKKAPLELTLVPAGKFMMGRNGDGGEVTLTRPFYLGLSHVTVDQFTAFTDATGYRTDAEQKGSAEVLLAPKGSFNPTVTAGASWRNAGFPQQGDHPVVQITWNDARAFCAWASQSSGRIVCLPTEAQWEFACRAGSIGLDPEASADNRAPKALEPLFQFEMQFTGPAQPRYLGGRVHVRISHNPAPLGEQWYRSLRQQFMKRFAV